MFLKIWNDQKGNSADSKKERKSDSQIRVMPDRKSMLFPDRGHESGWIRKQFERDSAAVDGNGWKSKA